MAAPFVHEHRRACSRQRIGERQVMAGGYAERRQPQQRARGMWRNPRDQLERMAIGRLQVEGPDLGPVHRSSPAPAWSSTTTSPRPGRVPC